MTLQQETNQIVANAQAAYKRGEITAQQYQDVTRIPLKDMCLTIYADGYQYPVDAVVLYDNGHKYLVTRVPMGAQEAGQ